jgi:Protein kinase domain
LEQLQSGDPERVGQYLLLGRLGAGGMGLVFLGRSPGGRLVSVKVIRAEMAADPEFRARFVREVAAARKVNGLFTAAVVDADPEARLPWLVTNFVNGPSLTQAVAERGALPPASVLALAAGLAEGLGAVHAAGVVHRDLKPSNVLLAADGPRLIDFGISQAADGTVLTSTGMVVGSPGFMSPEQAEGNPVGPASDVFSLGAVLVFAASGEGPFGTGTPGAQLYRVIHAAPRLDRLPGQLRPLVERCLAKDPAQRFTAAQFLAELTAVCPSAADLSDWLPPGILPVTSPLTAPAGLAADRAPLPADRAPAGAPPGAWTPTLTAAAQHPAARTAAGKRRRRWAVAGIAAVAVIGVVAGVLIATPGKPAPVLRPAGLTSDSAAVSEVAFRWSGPATGPVPDRYEIFRDGRLVGHVPGNVTFYHDTGLAPASSYKYQVTAIRDGKPSPRSYALDLDTVTPPVSDAALGGTWTAHYTVSSTNHFTWKGAKSWSDTWVFTPVCQTGPCGVTLAGKFNGSAFTASLTRAGAVYAGTAPLRHWAYCSTTKTYIPSTLSIRIQVQDAGVTGQAWTASEWRGTAAVNIAKSKCNPAKVNTSVSSSAGS